MPDPITIVMAMAVAAASAAVLLLVCGWPWRSEHFSHVDAGWVLGLGVGFFVGAWVLGNRPHWPLREDQDRLLGLVLPAVVIVELLAAFPRVPRWLTWPLRAAVVLGVAPVLVYGSTYLSDQNGPGTAEWSTVQAALILGGLAAFLATVCSLLALLSSRAPGASPAVCLAITSAAAAVTVMLSGYATGGQDGLPLGAALAGAALTVSVLKWSSRGRLPLGVAVVGLYSLLVIGRFFGELSSAHAILLFAGPLLAWLPELPVLRRLPRWARNLARVLLVALLVSAILIAVGRKFLEDSPSRDSESEGPTADDYMNYGR
jgi:hypothetical protein